MSTITDIDHQHNELFNKLHQLKHAVRGGEPQQDIERIIEDIISYTRLHLEYEEQVMGQHQYPDLAWHKNKHKILIEDVLRLNDQLKYAGELEFLEWLDHWPLKRLHAHIEFADKPAENYINQTLMKQV